MHPLDLGILIAYLLLVTVIALVVMRRTRTGDDLFLAGRSLGWGVIGLSLFASNISSTTLIGLAGAAYASGIAVANYEWMAGLVLVFMALFVIPVFLRQRISTVPGYLGLRYDGWCQRYFSGLTIFMSIVVDTAGGLFAGALVMSFFFPGVPLSWWCVGMAVFAGLYTAAGGLRAVVYTDAVQAVVLLAGSAAITWFVFERFDFDWSAAMAAVPADHLSLIRPLDDASLPGLGTLVGVPILGFWYWATNQYITQRLLGARSLDDARWGALLAGALKLLPLLTMVLPGALALVLYPGLAQPDQVFPKLVHELLPIGFKGLVVAGLFAAIMSTIDSTLNSATTLIIKDFVEPARAQRGRPALSPTQEARWGRLTTLGLMTVAALWAPQISQFEGLFAYLQQAFSVVVPPVVVVFLAGLFWQRATARAARLTLLGGHALGVAFFVAGQWGAWPWHFTLTVGLVTALCALLMVVLSLRDPQGQALPLPGHANPEALARWQPGDLAIHPPRAGWRGAALDYRLQAAVVVALTAWMLVVFW
mgnify:FL=1